MGPGLGVGAPDRLPAREAGLAACSAGGRLYNERDQSVAIFVPGEYTHLSLSWLSLRSCP